MGLRRGLAWDEDAATFYLDGEDGNPATIIYDYKNVSGEPRAAPGGRGRGCGTGLTRVCLQAAAGELQIPAPPRLLHHPHGQGQHPGAGCHRPDLPAPGGEDHPPRSAPVGDGGVWGAPGDAPGMVPHAAPPPDEEPGCSIMPVLPRLSFCPLARLRRGWPCPWPIAPSWAPRRASSAASSPSTGLSLAG